jgi:altronate hydrolase
MERKPAGLDKLMHRRKMRRQRWFQRYFCKPGCRLCSDLLVALGGKVLLAEFPELCGAEQELMIVRIDEKMRQKSSFTSWELIARLLTKCRFI